MISMQGCNFGCPSVSKSIVYKFGDKYSKKMTIGVLGVENKSANVQVTLPKEFEVRKRTGGPVSNETANEDTVYKLVAEKDDLLDIVEAKGDIPVATIEVIAVHPKGEFVREGILANEDYIFANVLHPTKY